MPRVVLQPCAARESMQHYTDTVENPVDFLSRASEFVPSVLRRLRERHPDGRAPMWGLVPGPSNQRSHGQLMPGDAVLFGGSGRYFARAVVTVTWDDTALARSLWGTEGDSPDGRTWSLMYALTPPTELDLPYEALNLAVGYSPNKVPQGFQVLDQKKSDQVLTLLDGTNGTTRPDSISASAYREAIGAPEGELEREVVTRARVEQLYLRQTLFGAAQTFHCAICEAALPVDLLVAAHIKKRADCTREEKLDAANIVMAACKLGCDELYERGYIAVGQTGTVIVTSRPLPEALTAALAALEGRVVSAHTPHTKDYFAAHREGVFRRRESAASAT